MGREPNLAVLRALSLFSRPCYVQCILTCMHRALVLEAFPSRVRLRSPGAGTSTSPSGGSPAVDLRENLKTHAFAIYRDGPLTTSVTAQGGTPTGTWNSALATRGQMCTRVLAERSTGTHPGSRRRQA